MLVIALGACVSWEDGTLPRPPTAYRPEAAGPATDTFLADGVEIEFFLSRIPIPYTIAGTVTEPSGVFVDMVEAVGAPPAGDWQFDPTRNSVVLLHYVPPTDSVVRFEYVVASNVQ